MRAIKPEEVHHCGDCGAEAQMTWNGKEFSVWCTKCKNSIYALTQEKALIDWNRLNPESEVKPFSEVETETPDTLPKLKPCPFCGSKNLAYEGLSKVICRHCGASSGLEDENETRIEKWNQRVEE